METGRFLKVLQGGTVDLEVMWCLQLLKCCIGVVIHVECLIFFLVIPSKVQYDVASVVCMAA